MPKNSSKAPERHGKGGVVNRRAYTQKAHVAYAMLELMV